MYHIITQGAAGTLAVQTDEERFAIMQEPRGVMRSWERKTIIFNPVELAQQVAIAQVWLNQQRKAGRL